MTTRMNYQDFETEAVLDEKQCAELLDWPLSVFREAVLTSALAPPQLTYKGKPMWLARNQHIAIPKETT